MTFFRLCPECISLQGYTQITPYLRRLTTFRHVRASPGFRLLTHPFAYDTYTAVPKLYLFPYYLQLSLNLIKRLGEFLARSQGCDPRNLSKNRINGLGCWETFSVQL